MAWTPLNLLEKWTGGFCAELGFELLISDRMYCFQTLGVLLNLHFKKTWLDLEGTYDENCQ